MHTSVRIALLRATFPLVELPIYLYCLAGACVGRMNRAARLHNRVAERIAGAGLGSTARRRLLVTSVLVLPLNLALFTLAAYLWSVLPVNLAYPLRPDTTAESLQRAWGGPSLAGAWAVHALGAAAFFALLGVPLLRGVVWLQVRLLRLLIGGHQPLPDPGRPAVSR